jgi:quercetin 2,3-dioxygenase
MIASNTIKIRRSDERGRADHGWLKSRFSFSFADYYDPAHMGFRALRVINDDVIAPLGGFPTHPHRDMEIFSYVLEGQLAHEDSMGNKRVLNPGEIQLMRAGSGVRHSEFNPSATAPARLLQIWITPHTRGLDPDYTEWQPPAEARVKTLVISPDGAEGSARIAQDARIYRILTDKQEVVRHTLEGRRGMWLHVIRGGASIEGADLRSGDAMAIEHPAELEITTSADGFEALLFDLG